MREQVKLGQEVEVTVDAFPGRNFKAKITTIEPQIRTDTRMMSIQATMPNPDEALLPGMFVNAAVILPPEPAAVVLPETAVDYTLYGDSAYVVREDGTDADGKPVLKAVRTPVKTGKRWDGKVAVLSGVKPGDTVVAAGQVKLQDGAVGGRYRRAAAATGQADPAIDRFSGTKDTEEERKNVSRLKPGRTRDNEEVVADVAFVTAWLSP